MKEEGKHYKLNSDISLNTRFWIADNSKLLNMLKKIVFMLYLIYLAYHEGNMILDSAEIRAMELNNKMDTITLYHGKTAKNIIIEWVLWNMIFILYYYQSTNFKFV